jgi:hypothetical protein
MELQWATLLKNQLTSLQILRQQERSRRRSSAIRPQALRCLHNDQDHVRRWERREDLPEGAGQRAQNRWRGRIRGLVLDPYCSGGAGSRKEMYWALEKLLEIGKPRSIGVSNWGIGHIEELKGFCEGVSSAF